MFVDPGGTGIVQKPYQGMWLLRHKVSGRELLRRIESGQIRFLARSGCFGPNILTNGKPPMPTEGYQWVIQEDYSDEFNGDRLNSNKWHDHHPRWRGRPPARFMPENVSVKNGMLWLTNEMLEQPIMRRDILLPSVVQQLYRSKQARIMVIMNVD